MIDVSQITKTGAWSLEDSGDGVFFLRFKVLDEKVNILSEAVLRDLDALMDKINGDASIRVLIVIGDKPETGTFIAGANVNEIRSVTSPAEASEGASRGQGVLSRFSTCNALTIAAIHGNCLGGGTELALACDLRIATKDSKTRIGLPEVQLGLLPGFGGSQRLPRLVGIMNALPMILTGKPKRAEQAARIGLVDQLVYPSLLEKKAREMALHALSHGGKSYRPKRSKRPLFARLLEGTPVGRSFIRNRARKDVIKRAGQHYPAPLKAIDAVIDGFSMSLEQGLKLEAQLVGELIASPVCKSLIDLFLSSEEMRRGPASAELVEKGSRLGLLGAGVMGGGIAEILTRKGYRVRVKDISHESIQIGLQKVKELFSKRVKKRRMSKSEMDRGLSAITTTLEYDGFSDVRFAIEAVVENMGIKKQVLRELEDNVHEDAVLATNTSSLSITEMQAALDKPERLVGLHFFNPVDRMMLVEIIRGEHTSDEAVAAAGAVAKQIGKIPVPVGDGPGFLVNRLLGPYLTEAVYLFAEGYSPVEIDDAIREFGMPMGPFELLDEVGLDVAAKVCRVLFDAFGERSKPPALLSDIAELPGVLGKKSGRGFYVYRGGQKGRANAEVLRLSSAKEFLPANKDLWIKRLIYPIINEAARTLEEGIAEKASHIDLAMVMGTGFAPFRGGPLRYADDVGVSSIRDSLKQLGEERFVPCTLLEEMTESRQSFYGAQNDAAQKDDHGGSSSGAVSSSEGAVSS